MDGLSWVPALIGVVLGGLVTLATEWIRARTSRASEEAARLDSRHERLIPAIEGYLKAVDLFDDSMRELMNVIEDVQPVPDDHAAWMSYSAAWRNLTEVRSMAEVASGPMAGPIAAKTYSAYAEVSDLVDKYRARPRRPTLKQWQEYAQARADARRERDAYVSMAYRILGRTDKDSDGTPRRSPRVSPTPPDRADETQSDE